MPIRIRVSGSKTFNNFLGKTAVGLVYRFDSGSHYSNTRTMTASQLNPAMPGQFGSTASQYLDDTRGGGVYNASSYLDLSVTHDFPLFKAMGKDVTAFAKFNIGNVFNHQQIVTFNTSWNRVPTPTSNPAYAYPNAYSAPWVKTPASPTYTGFGNPQSFGNFGTPRTVNISAGFRF